jgi:hypothetical protein
MKAIINFPENENLNTKINDFSIELNQIDPLYLHFNADYENQSLVELKKSVSKQVVKVIILNDEDVTIYESEEWKEIHRLTINYHPGYEKLVINFTLGV